MDFLPIFIKMIELFLIIIIGFVTTKLHIINETIKTSLSKVILTIALPCTILASVMTTENMPSTSEIFIALLLGFISYFIFFLLSKLTSAVFRLNGKVKAAAEFGIMFANVGFIGYPVTQAIFGDDCIFITSLYNMPFNLICYSYGVYLLEKGNIDSDNQAMTTMSFSKLIKLLINPAFICSCICMIIALGNIKIPAFIGDTCALVGNITTPGALIIIGSALGALKFSQMFTSLKAYLVTIVSVIVTPLVIYFIFRLIPGISPLIFGEAVIISAMPVATSGTMLCVEHGGDEKFMARITFLSTLLSVITIPLIATIL